MNVGRDKEGGRCDDDDEPPSLPPRGAWPPWGTATPGRDDKSPFRSAAVECDDRGPSIKSFSSISFLILFVMKLSFVGVCLYSDSFSSTAVLRATEREIKISTGVGGVRSDGHRPDRWGEQGSEQIHFLEPSFFWGGALL